jgi:peptidoglycan hydrolase CwlO-like protein
MAEDKFPERITKVETILEFHEKRLESLEKGMNDLSHKVEDLVNSQREVLSKVTITASKIEGIEKELTIKSIKWLVEKIGLPIVLVVLTAIILRALP